MTEVYQLPIKVVGSQKWGCLAYLGKDHEFIGEDFKVVANKYTFHGNHRVRLYRIIRSVYWKIPGAVVADIQNVAAPTTPMRRRHHK